MAGSQLMPSPKLEIIVAAAIRHGDLVISMPKPARHHSMLIPFEMLTGVIVVPDDQGFLTNTGRYVGRVEGDEIALKAGHTKKLQWGPSLYNEDLW